MAAGAIVVYGIPNCDTVKKARVWLDEHGIDYVFHDFKKAGVNAGLIESWLADVAIDALVNRRGTTWRGLDDAQKASADTQPGAIALLLAQPSMIKRPVLSIDGRVVALGFDAALYAGLFDA
jgi:arsenate reductase (glutaredoxin)